MNPSVGIVCRIYLGEIPYIFGFIDYYLRIGVKKFYLIICDKTEEKVIKDFLKPYSKHIFYYVHRKPVKSIDRDGFEGFENLIREDYILNVDVDEFLYLKFKGKQYKTIQEFIIENPFDKYFFDWIMVVNDGCSSKNMGFVKKKMGKVMVKSSNGIKKIICHDVELEKTDIREFYDDVFVIHYWGRTMEDIIIKCIFGKMPDKKRTSLEVMIEDINKGILPVRFRLMALLSKAKKDIEIPNFVYDKIRFDIESTLIEKFKHKNKLIDLYKKYLDKLNYEFVDKFNKEDMTLLKVLPMMPQSL